MGCFFDCFCFRHEHPRRRALHVPNSSPSAAAEEGAQRIRLSSLFTAEEDGVEREERVVKDRENLVRRVGWSEVDEELVEEAKFLKACGTLPQTPVEIRKSVTLAEGSDMPKPPSQFKYSPERVSVMQQPENLSENSEKVHLKGHHSMMESSPETPEAIKKDEALTEQSDLRGPRSVLKSSPYPTPMKLTDDMQTPGTVFATNMKSLLKGNVRIRSQYVHTVINPIENLSQQQELKEANSILDETSGHKELLSEEGNATPSHAMTSGENPARKENIGEATLSSWLKTQQPNDDGDCGNLVAASSRKPNVAKTLGDRPIIGLVATHWNEQEETSNVSPKWWDGNGIPNSTTKYKEDQKVRWHATPFEERLEKALSEETFPQRKPITGMPMMLEEMEGDDTATSHAQSMNCPNPKSMVSF